MIYAFVQDSSVIEIVHRQRQGILSYARERGLTVERWLDPSSFNLEELKKNDVLLIEKTFRLGKDIRTITTIMQELLQRGVIICSCEDNLKFGEDYVLSKVMAHIFGIVKDTVEELHSRLTKEALASCRQNGRTLGRSFGRKNAHQKWDAKKSQIKQLLQAGASKSEVCRQLDIPRSSLWRYVKDHPELMECV